MKHWFRLALPLLLGALVPLSLAAQRATPSPPPPTMLFVCEHGTVKSLLAKVLFEEYAAQVGLNMQALSRGTKADSAVPPFMMQGLNADHVSLGAWTPKTLGVADLAVAAHVVSFDVPSSSTAAARAPKEQWDGLPSVTKDYAAGRDAIKARVHVLVDSLKRAETRGKSRAPRA